MPRRSWCESDEGEMSVRDFRQRWRHSPQEGAEEGEIEFLGQKDILVRFKNFIQICKNKRIAYFYKIAKLIDFF